MRVFQETQRFNQWWLKILKLMMLGLIIYLCYQWFYLEKQANSIAADDTTGQLVVIGTLLLTSGLFYILRLRTSIDERGIHYQFIPFHFKVKTTTWNNIEACFTRTYEPIKEFGGWGYRIGFKGQALNVKGTKGIQLVFKNGKKLLIGTQNPEEAQRVIDRYFKKEIDKRIQQ